MNIRISDPLFMFLVNLQYNMRTNFNKDKTSLSLLPVPNVQSDLQFMNP